MMFLPRHLTLVTLLFAGVLLVACGDDPQVNNNGVFVSNNGGNNGGSDTGVDADGGQEQDADGDTQEHNCTPRVEQLGELVVGEAISIEREFTNLRGSGGVSCAETQSGAGAHWFAFSVPEVVVITSEVRASLSANPTVELMEGSCGDTGQKLFCLQADNFRRVLEPGVTYFLLVQGSQDTTDAQFTFTYTLESTLCAPGPNSCSSGTVEYCDGGDQLLERQCVGSCLDDTSCAADTCDTAVSIDVSTLSTPMSLTGDQLVYDHDWDADERPGCSIDGEGGVGGPSEGVESFLQLTGVQSGDTISFDGSSGDTSLGFYVLDACDAGECVTAGAWDDVGDNVFEWTASAAGEYVVVVEALGRTRDLSFEFTIERQSAAQ